MRRAETFLKMPTGAGTKEASFEENAEQFRAPGNRHEGTGSSPGPFRGFGQDLRYAVRGLRERPGFTLVALVTLAMGIGVNTAMFSVVNATLLTPVPIPSPDRVVAVWTDRLGNGTAGYPASEPDFADWQASGIFEQLAGEWTDGYSVLVGNVPLRVPGANVNPDWFALEGLKPYMGRVFRGEELQPGHNHVVVLTYNFWNSRLRADAAAVGKTLFVNSAPYVVIGVLAKNSPKIADEELYVPLTFAPPFDHQRGLRTVETTARLKPGMSLAATQARMKALSNRLAQQYPQADGGATTRLQPINEAAVADVRTLVVVLFCAVGAVLLVASANIANLLLVRGAERQKEMAIRAALGANAYALMRQLLTESVLLSITGGILGMVPAWIGIQIITKYKPEALPNSDLIGLNPAVLVFTLAVATGTGMLFGIIPAWSSWRASAMSPLRERSQASSRDLKLGNLFVIAEVGVTLILAVGASLMVRSFAHLRSAYPGFDASVLSIRVSLTGKEYATPEEQVQFSRRAIELLRSMPGVRSAAAMDVPPTSGEIHAAWMDFTDRVDTENNRALIAITPVTPEYLDTMHIPLIEGRRFNDADRADSAPVTMLDEVTAKHYWPKGSPIGQKVSFRPNRQLYRIVGIVGAIDRTGPPTVKVHVGEAYLAFAQAPTPDFTLLIASARPGAGFAAAAERKVSQMIPDQAVYQVETIAQARAAGRTSARFGTLLLSFFATLALALAAIGVYGVIAYSVEQRTREIGVRMALGATQHELVATVLKRGLRLVTAGIVLGLCGSLALGKLLGELLHGPSATDPVAFVSGAALLFAAALLATYIPAFRASRIDPMVALRHD